MVRSQSSAIKCDLLAYRQNYDSDLNPLTMLVGNTLHRFEIVDDQSVIKVVKRQICDFSLSFQSVVQMRYFRLFSEFLLFSRVVLIEVNRRAVIRQNETVSCFWTWSTKSQTS